jgi:hypothetical protein
VHGDDREAVRHDVVQLARQPEPLGGDRLLGQLQPGRLQRPAALLQLHDVPPALADRGPQPPRRRGDQPHAQRVDDGDLVGAQPGLDGLENQGEGERGQRRPAGQVGAGRVGGHDQAGADRRRWRVAQEQQHVDRADDRDRGEGLDPAQQQRKGLDEREDRGRGAVARGEHKPDLEHADDRHQHEVL